MRTALVGISNSISLFDGNYPGGGNVTSVVFHSGREAFVFDSLLYPDDTRALLRGIRNLNLSVKGLVNTHWHVDHTAGNQLFQETHRVISHNLCGDLMRTEGKDDADWAKKRLKLEKSDEIVPVYPNEAAADGSRLVVGSLEIEILHTPGHTPDSVIGWQNDEGVVVAGDTVMELPFVGYGNSQALTRSLTRIQAIAGKRGKIIQGHGPVCDGEKLAGDISYIEEVRKRVAEYGHSGKTSEEAQAGIKLGDCVPKERARTLSAKYGYILWCHPSNVERVYAELKEEEAR